MVNFVLQYHLLEDKADRPYECEWCGDNFRGHKRKYCAPKCREEETKYNARKANRKNRIDKLDKELARLREENKELKCVVCDNELTGNQTLYCSTQCNNLARLDDRKRPTPVAPFDTGNKWHEGHYGKCNINIVEAKNPSAIIDLAPYTYESEAYLRSCLEEIPQARYSDGTFHASSGHKSSEYYYGKNNVKMINKHKRRNAILNIIAILRQRAEDLHNQ